MSVSLRPALMGAVAGATLLATIAALPAFAQASPTPPNAARATIAGSVPIWAQASARAGAVDPAQQRKVEVALAPRDLAGAEKLASEVATPGSPRFRHPLSAAQYEAQFGPSQQTVTQVSAWLASQGLTVTGISGNRELIDATGTVGALQTAFGTHLSAYRTDIHGKHRTLDAPDSPISVPATYHGTSLAGAVQAVLGLDDSDQTITTDQATVAVPAATAADGTGCSRYWDQNNNTAVPQKYASGQQSNVLCGYLTPQMRSMYGLGTGATGSGTTVAVVGAYNEASIVADTNHAASDFGNVALASGQYTAYLPSAFNSNPSCDVESWNAEQALDVQSIHTIAPAAKIDYYAATDCTTLVAAFTQAVSADQASVITDSWGYTGEANVPASDRSAFESAAVQAAAQGQSVMFSTGDNGDNSTTTGSVSANFPATDPWVTAVGGATIGLNSSNKAAVETGWEDEGEGQSGSGWAELPAAQGGFAGGSGGGTSSLYATPTYQSKLSPAQTGGHRAIPDIAGSADPYTGFAIGYTSIAANGYVDESYGGTSEAAPLTAGLVADAGQVVGNGGWLGLINPALYQFGANAITDVQAQQAGVWTPYYPKGAGPTGSYLIDFGANQQSLRAGAGWDDETGVGVPNSGFISALASAATS
jgi:subtilase family serine protease